MAKKFDFLSPGIEIREIDQSFIPAQVDAEGPIIIGRTRKGPANKPVKVSNLDDFVSVFGLPVAGGNGAQGDMWRDGNMAGPTYASYAAQAWLASEESPVTIVRIAGEHSENATDASTALAGWQVGSEDISTNGASTAYGLFLCDKPSTAGILSKTLTFASYDTGSLDNKSATFFSGSSTQAFKVVFESTEIPTAGTWELDSTSSPPEFTIHISGATEDTTMGLVEEVLEYASLSNYVQVSVDNNGTNLEIFNLMGEELGLSTATTGIFELDSVDVNVKQTINAAPAGTTADATLAAVLYCTTGSLTLTGTLADATVGNGAGVDAAGTFVESVGAGKEFKLNVYSDASTLTETITFNFSKGNSNYIRSVMNTNPQLTHETLVDADDRKTYWLGESFLASLEEKVTKDALGEVFATLIPLSKGELVAENWGYHRTSATEAMSGWVFSQKSTQQENLFRIKSLHVGEEIQKNYVISIEDIAEPANVDVNPFGKFTVAVKTLAGETVERYTGCNLNPSSADYVAARIGDQYITWSETDKRYRTYGDFQNQSDIVYIEMADKVANGAGQGLLPAGFYGPVQPKGFGALDGDLQYKQFDLTQGDFADPAVHECSSSVILKGHADSTTALNMGFVQAATFSFPKMKMRVNGDDGGAPNQARSYWGVRPKVNSTSNLNDPDWVDYTRKLGLGLGNEGSHIPADDTYEYSFTFSLEDISGSADLNEWSWAEGNYDADNSFSKTNGFSDLLTEGVKQFAMPLWGGSEGFDIKEMEPLRNDLIAVNDTLSPKTNYVDFSISKAIDSILDPEVVPANLLLMPGINKPAATNKIISAAETRKDVLSIVDLEGDYVPRVESISDASARLGDVKEAVSEFKNRRLNSSYACAFYPWVQISDNLNGNKLVWIPPSVAALGAFGRSQAQSEVWFAPAGFNRGGLGSLGGSRGPRVTQARQRLDSSERDALYEIGINPIATFPAEGVVIFGQKTLQADQSALDRINVRRLVLHLKSKVSVVARNLLFDQNVESTWNRFKSQVKPILSDARARYGLSDYKLILDSTTTTADLVDRNIMYAKIYIKPARAIEYIVVDFVITKTGADFV